MGKCNGELEPELLEGLGKVVVSWSVLEQRVSDLFVALTEGNPGSMIVVTANVSQNAITGWIRTLLDLYDFPEELTDDIKETLDTIDIMRADRNGYVHGHWTATSEPGSALVQTVRLERSEIAHSLVVTPVDLDDFAFLACEVTGKLRSLLASIPSEP